MITIRSHKILLQVWVIITFNQMKNILGVILLCLPNLFLGQVAINTTNLSDAVVLHLEAKQYPTTNYGGFLMPVVNEIQQSSIPVSTVDLRDDGLMVYLFDENTGKQCWDIYDAVVNVWRSITCFNQVCNGVIFSEDFNSYSADSGITGASATNGDYPMMINKFTLSSFSSSRDGSLAYPGTLANASDYALVKNGQLEIQDANGPLLFETQSIDISGYTNINFSFTIYENGNLEYDSVEHIDDFNCGEESIGNDYVDVLYSTNGGSTFIEVPNYNGLGNSNHTLIDNLVSPVTVSVNGLSGHDLVIRIRFQNWAGAEQYFLDDITVSCD